jgi:hypothetical protein
MAKNHYLCSGDYRRILVNRSETHPNKKATLYKGLLLII